MHPVVVLLLGRLVERLTSEPRVVSKHHKHGNPKVARSGANIDENVTGYWRYCGVLGGTGGTVGYWGYRGTWE
jgi:hypothetical protein